MSCGIYAIVNKINNKKYIGSTGDTEKRFDDHFRDLEKGIHKNIHLQAAYNKYGMEAFYLKILILVAQDKLLKAEQHFLDAADWDNLYNIAPLASGGEQAEETIEKIRKANKGKKRTTETVEKMKGNQNALGHKCTKENIKNMSIAQIKRYESEGEIEKARERMKGNKYALGYKHSNMQKRNSSIAQTERWDSEEERKKQSKALKGNKKLSKAMKGNRNGRKK